MPLHLFQSRQTHPGSIVAGDSAASSPWKPKEIKFNGNSLSVIEITTYLPLYTRAYEQRATFDSGVFSPSILLILALFPIKSLSRTHAAIWNELPTALAAHKCYKYVCFWHSAHIPFYNNENYLCFLFFTAIPNGHGEVDNADHVSAPPPYRAYTITANISHDKIIRGV